MGKKYTAEQTKNMILDTSAVLFIKKGYEQTSISDIVSGLDGLTRGAVYHHFDSKHDIIVGIADRFVLKKEILRRIKEKSELNGLEKIQEILLESMFNKEIMSSTKNSLALLTDPTFSSLYNCQIVNNLSPEIESCIKEGMADGSIETESPKQMSEVVLLLISTWFIQSLFPNTLETFVDKLKTAQFVLKASGIDVLSEKIVDKILEEVTLD
ncbi:MULTISPECIES: TetR/AcrR family transcriptional regulator [Vagococcus]|uniref:Transcriptional regulator, TetR family n=1 Tax=Vagococcus fluvialis bH819 TaxID=1255619 RepID=A0A1X6WP62_9ENTE|nr:MULTISPECIES: TetR/AcrR family transcriptional regulator [Vagococcus]SLM85456.1 Transcriptional regulator, TetR family [Vagococcus fluvialis bH819]HCM89251.1 TetR/AcrR family transcriptional regulator [Vagococcus sp.]